MHIHIRIYGSIYLYIYIYIYIYIYVYGNRIPEGLHPGSPVVGVPGSHYFDCKGHLIDIIESLFFQLVQSDRFNENVYFSWL